jgi:transglutaminase-like putative cysteine protease
MVLGGAAVLPAFAQVAGAQAASAQVAAVPTGEAAWRWAPLPDWVVPVEPIKSADATARAADGVRYLLYDRQYRFDGTDNAFFFRELREASTVGGVEEIADLRLSFDPTHEEILLHSVKLVRDGVVTDLRNVSKFELLREEADLDDGYYSGEVTLYIRHPDVRRGDAIEIAYTRTGRSTTLGNHDQIDFGLTWSIPVERQHVRVLWSTAHLGAWRVVGSGAEITETREGPMTVLTFAPAPVPGQPSERGIPDWRRQYAGLQVSSFRDWADVVAWGLGHYNQPIPAEVRVISAELRAEHPTPEEQIAAALRFVQDDVRYLAVLVGTGGYAPRPTAEVLRSRFGDCKEKSLLFVQLLRALNIDAVPAFADLDEGRGIDTGQLPAPQAFDHVIARVSHAGKTYWFDATRRHQGGTLANLTQADLGFVLPLKAGVAALERIPDQVPTEPTLEMFETIDLSAGPDAPVKMQVRTVMRGEEADSIRARLADDGVDGLEESYGQFYEGEFGPTVFVGRMRSTDDREANVVEVFEELELLDAFTPHDTDETAVKFTYRAHALSSPVNDRAQRRRTTPLAVTFPNHVRTQTTVILTDGGENWNLPGERVDLNNPAFDFRLRSRRVKERYTMEYTLKSKAAEVGEEHATTVIRDTDRLQREAYWSLTVRAPVRAQAPAPAETTGARVGRAIREAFEAQ